MEIVQLGLFSSVYNWVYNKILDPLFDKLSSLLTKGFEYLVDVASAVLGPVMEGLFGKVFDLILEWYYSKWFLVQSAVLLLLDCIEDCFDIVSGLSPVYIKGQSGSGQGVPLLFAVFSQKTIQNAFMAMIVVGFSICFAMAILATARTFFELGSEKTKPMTHIMRMTARSLLYLLIAPMVVTAMILLSQAILKTIDKAVSFGNEEKTSIARIIFCISSLDAVDTDAHKDGKEYNISYEDGPSKASLTDKYRKQYYYREKNPVIPNYTNPIKVKLDFVYRGFDYFVGIGCGIFFTIIMCMVLAVFIGRIFDVIVLVIIQPFFVGMMPFDDGEYYKRWFELFLGKLFQGFGSVVAMRVYLLILEQLFSGQIRFSNSDSVGARLQDYLMMLLFAMGGGVAVRHIGPLVTGILSQSAATGEQMNAYEGLKVGQAVAGKELELGKFIATKSLKYGGMAVGITAGRFMGKGGSVGSGGSGMTGPGNSSGAPGRFVSSQRPANTMSAANLRLSGSQVKSSAQRSLESYRTVLPGSGGASTGSKAGGGQFGAFTSQVTGLEMQDIVGGPDRGSMTGVEGSGAFDKPLEDVMSRGGHFDQAAGGRTMRSTGSGQSMADMVSSGTGSGQSMADLVSSGTGSGQSMADMVSSGTGSGQSMADMVSSGTGSGQSMADVISSGSGSGRSAQDMMSAGTGSERSMQDILGTGSGMDNDITGGSFEDPLNTGFYMDRGDEDDD